jgi:hypothetical protein
MRYMEEAGIIGVGLKAVAILLSGYSYSPASIVKKYVSF